MPYIDTRPGDLDAPRPLHKKVNFDPTINLGHLLTAGAMLVAGFVAWSQLDKRVVVLEVTQQAQQQAQRERDANQDQRLREAVEALQETSRRIEKVLDVFQKQGR